MKDPRITYINERISFANNVISFDGKGDPDKKMLKVYRYYGDVSIARGALRQFMESKGYDKLYIPAGIVS